MHQIVLLTALSATTGLFGGGRPARTSYYYGGYTARNAYYYAPSTCSTGACPRVNAAAPAAAPARQAAPVAAAPVAAAPAPVAPAYQTARYAPRMTYSYYYPTQSSCPNGQCSRR
jgi:hypothetical protein